MDKSALKFKRGMVLVVVTAAIMMMMMIVVGILSRSTSRVTASDTNVKRIQAEALAKGSFWKAYQTTGGPAAGTTTLTETVGGTTFTIDTTNYGAGTGPGGGAKIGVSVTY